MVDPVGMLSQDCEVSFLCLGAWPENKAAPHYGVVGEEGLRHLESPFPAMIRVGFFPWGRVWRQAWAEPAKDAIETVLGIIGRGPNMSPGRPLLMGKSIDRPVKSDQGHEGGSRARDRPVGPIVDKGLDLRSRVARQHPGREMAVYRG